MSLKDRLATAIATWFGCGYAPKGPGTAGSLAALLIAILIRPSTTTLWVMIAITTVVGTWAAGAVAKRLKREDPGLVVVDEVAGQWITLAAAPTYEWKSWLIALILFRLFDIWKPPPVRQFESLPGGFGIMADDIMAGVYGALVIVIVGRLHLY